MLITKALFLQFILMPLIIVVLVLLMVVVKHVNETISNTTVIVFIILFGLVMAIPGLFGFVGDTFSPWYYLLAQLIYLLLGIIFVQLYYVYFKKVENVKILFQLIALLIITSLGGYLFAVIFNLISETGGGYIAATCMLTFPVPVIFYHVYRAFLAIPFEIYDVWVYPKDSEAISFDGQDFNKLMVLELEFSRNADDKNRLKVKAKAPAEMPLGSWFKKFIDDYNYKFPNNTIGYLDADGFSHGWIFYSKRSFFHRRRMLDPADSIKDNKIQEHVTIISKRVIEHTEEQFAINSKKLQVQI
ncbi:MAG TPA: TssN family type VI secretion system protein [Ferruginibacter sp.]|jgi:hypothetical protein|nr:TssN family type VI secretion system protein [Ferruginibacter sp.]